MDPTTTLHKKGLVKPDPRILALGAARAAGDGASRLGFESYAQQYLTPQRIPQWKSAQPGDNLHALRFHEILFVYAETGKTLDKDWVLLGTEYQWGLESTERVLGWLPRVVVEEWFTREALQWNTSKTRPADRGVIWRTAEAALKFGPTYVIPSAARSGTLASATPSSTNPTRSQSGNDQQSAVPSEALFVERFLDGKPVNYRPELARYPILQWPAKEKYLEREEYLKWTKEGWELVRVGVSGSYVNDQGEEIASAEEIRELQEKLRLVRERMSNLQILLVVDETESMRPWFHQAAKAVEEVINRLRREHRGTVSLAITYYSDSDPDRPWLPPVRGQRLTSDPAEIQRRIEELRTHKVGRGGDPREMVFRGIVQGVREAGFDPLATKLLILLGDDADKSDENDPQHRAEQEVMRALLNFPVPIQFFAIQVVSPEVLANRPVAQAFRKQMSTICQLYTEEVNRSVKIVPGSLGDLEQFEANVLSTAEVEKVIASIKDKIDRMRNWMVMQTKRLDQLRLGAVTAEVGPAVDRILEELGLRELVDRLRAGKGFQLYFDGYAWIPKSQTNLTGPLEVVLLLSGRELEDTVRILEDVVGELGAGDWKAEGVRRILEKALGEESKNFLDLMIKSTALVQADSRLNKLLRNMVTEQDLGELGCRMMRLEDILRDIEFDYVRSRTSPSLCMRQGEGKVVRRWFQSFTGEVRWYWIRVQDEWP
jgi:hypothetical protein